MSTGRGHAWLTRVILALCPLARDGDERTRQLAIKWIAKLMLMHYTRSQLLVALRPDIDGLVEAAERYEAERSKPCG